MVSPRHDRPETRRHRETQAAKTQALFREVNERVREVNVSFLTPVGEWFCECEHDSCVDRIEMSVNEYDSVRLHGARFLVSPGHAHASDADRVIIERNARYWVIENTGLAGELAERYWDIFIKRDRVEDIYPTGNALSVAG